MSIDNGFPTPLELLKLELQTFRYLKGKKFIAENFPTFSKDVSSAHDRLSSSIKNSSCNCSFESGFEVEYQGGSPLFFHVCTKIISKGIGKKSHYSEVSYVLSICRDIEADDKKILRKYHFDYVNSKNLLTHIPIYHLQYGGELTPYLRNKSYTDKIHGNILHSWLSEPRIIYQPTSLALLLDMIFNEFRSQTNNEILEDPEWRGLISKNEHTILKPFFKNCANIFNSCNFEYLFTRNYCYGN
jgi:hypothetical protein